MRGTPRACAAPALSWTRTAAAAGAAMSAQPPSLPNIPGRVEIDPVEQVMHEFPYGIYIVGSVEDGEPNGMIADWVMQVSFEPRLVAVALEDDSRSLARIRANRVFTVNLLTEEPDSMELARQFLQPYDASKIKGRSEIKGSERRGGGAAPPQARRRRALAARLRLPGTGGRPRLAGVRGGAVRRGRGPRPRHRPRPRRRGPRQRRAADLVVYGVDVQRLRVRRDG